MITQKPQIRYNAIPEQIKVAANSLTIAEWNAVINILKTQSNANAAYIQGLHAILFGDDPANANTVVDLTSYYGADGTNGTLECFMHKVKSAIDSIIEHRADLDNPHEVTTNQIGAMHITHPAYAITESLISQWIAAYGHSLLVNSNPHGTAIDQIDGVQLTFPCADLQALVWDAAIDRFVNYKLTPEDVGAEPANSNIQEHIASTSNPHNVTKTQVGLSNVENYGMASKAEAEAGMVTNKYMAPDTTKDALSKALEAYFTQIEINSKFSDLQTQIRGFKVFRGNKTFAELLPALLIEDNLGAVYQITEAFNTNEYFNEDAGNYYPENTEVAVCEPTPCVYKFNALGGTKIDSAYVRFAEDEYISDVATELSLSKAHLASTLNPHNVTYDQVGAEPANVNIQGHISATGNPHSTTYEDVGALPDSHDASGVTSQKITDWDTAFGWGDHAGLYALVVHNHDEAYSAIDHDHDEAYAALVHGHALADLTDINGTPTDGQAFVWNAATSKFVPTSIPVVLRKKNINIPTAGWVEDPVTLIWSNTVNVAAIAAGADVNVTVKNDAPLDEVSWLLPETTSAAGSFTIYSDIQIITAFTVDILIINGVTDI